MLSDDVLVIDNLESHHDNYGVALNAIDPNTRLNNFIDAVNLMPKNSDLEYKL